MDGFDLLDKKFLACVLGMVLIVEGLPYFAFAHRIKDWLALLMETRESTLRVLGFMAMVSGLLLVYWGRS